MSLSIASLNSGSNGNCYYVGNENEAVLIDAGISCREIEKRLRRLGLPLEKIKAVFISHEHSDHISGLPVFTRKHKLPVYITNNTLKFGGLRLEKQLVISFQSHTPVQIGNLSITPFPKWHDASDPYSFIISDNGVNVGVFTDIGHSCEQVISYFKKCHAAFLEANYDEEMLENGRYPYYLKARIRGDKGHLSNAQALELYRVHRSPLMTHLVLSHLSKNNNTPELVHEIFKPHANGVKIVVASRYEESEVFHIKSGPGNFSLKPAALVVSQLQFSFDVQV
jgi:phosphoribosyl 1,2-cyclic phosphodiesterase